MFLIFICVSKSFDRTKFSDFFLIHSRLIKDCLLRVGSMNFVFQNVH